MQLPAIHPILEAGDAAEAPTPRPAVVAVDLVKTYGSGEAAVTALGGVSASFRPGRFSAIMGPSGSGKSTLLHCLAGLDTPDSGEVLIGGTDTTRLKDKQLTRLRRSAIGFVFQSHNLLPTLTAAENIELPLLADEVLFLADGRLAGELETPTVSAVLDRLGGLDEGR
jgi:ABC-type lipoprotein export system ATPase subunit